jgi:polar amino acid transport system substrate-binding protein
MRLFRHAVLLVCVFLAAPASLAPSAQTKTSPLRLVSTEWTPFTNQPGQARFALDLVEAGLGRIGLSATTTLVEPTRFTTSLLSGEFDGSGAAWKDAERERVLLFSEPYLENRLILIARHGDDVSAAALSALKGKRIAIVAGYSYGDEVDKSGATLIRSLSEEDSLALLLQRKADYALMDDLVVQYIVQNYPNETRTRLSLGSKPLVTRTLHLAVRRARPDAESIIKGFNAQIRGMIADRTYHRLLHVSWIRADVDGDGVAEFVPQSDTVGPSEPQRAYAVLSTDTNLRASVSKEAKLSPPEENKPRFYFGGNIYTDWANVPALYKREDLRAPDPDRSTASLFRFTW